MNYRKLIFYMLAASGLGLAFSPSCVEGEQTLVSHKVSVAPVINADVLDPIWETVDPIVTTDKQAGIDIELKSVYTDDQIFFAVSFPDENENREHKELIWSPDLNVYKQSKTREDTFVFKWSMDSSTKDFSLKGDESYVADIWFWKAVRTDPVGYADDKLHVYSTVEQPKSRRLVSKSGKTFFLARIPDPGASPYKNRILSEYQKEKMARYELTIPTGSRADIRATGKWKDGRWTVVFARKLLTGNADDIQLGKSLPAARFGVSRYEIAGRPVDKSLDQPLYGSGDITEQIVLNFE